MPEIVQNGVTGCIVEDFDQAVEAVQAVRHLPRTGVRQVFERQFTAQAMRSAMRSSIGSSRATAEWPCSTGRRRECLRCQPEGRIRLR